MEIIINIWQEQASASTLTDHSPRWTLFINRPIGYEQYDDSGFLGLRIRFAALVVVDGCLSWGVATVVVVLVAAVALGFFFFFLVVETVVVDFFAEVDGFTGNIIDKND